jgi:hypothetical protein
MSRESISQEINALSARVKTVSNLQRDYIIRKLYREYDFSQPKLQKLTGLTRARINQIVNSEAK